MIPTVLGPFIVSAHYLSTSFWFIHVMLSTLHKHSGYDIPWYYNSTRHNTHHEKYFNDLFFLKTIDLPNTFILVLIQIMACLDSWTGCMEHNLKETKRKANKIN